MNSLSQPIESCTSTTTAWPRQRAARHELSQGFWVICDQAVISLASFLATVIVGRAGGTEALGVYVLAVTTFWLLAGIPNSLVWTPYTSRAPRMPLRRRTAYAGSVTWHMTALTAAVSAALLVAAASPISWIGGARWFAPMCVALVPFTAMMMLREHVRRICVTHLRTGDLLMIDVPIAVMQILLLLVLVKWNMLTATTALLAIALSCGAAGIWLARQRHEFRRKPGRASLHWSYNLQFGRWLLAVSLAWLLGDSSYRWIVGWFHGLDAVGQLAAAQATVMCINPLLLTVHNFGRAVSANRFANGGMRELRRVTWQATLLVIAAAGTAFICIGLVGGPLVRLIFGGQYAGLGSVVATLCLGMFARILVVPIDAAMVTLRYGRAMFIATLVQLLVILGAGVLLIRWLGLDGVGYAMALGFAAAAVIQWCLFLRGSADDTP